MNAAQRAHHELARALHQATRAGAWIACQAPLQTHLWISNKDDELNLAAELCEGCPVLDACRRAGEYEVAGVYGARVRLLRGRCRQPKQRAARARQPKPWSVNPNELLPELLAALAPLDAATGNDVARAMNLKPGSAAVRHTLARAHELGYVHREIVNRKLHRWTITEHGRARLDRARVGGLLRGHPAPRHSSPGVLDPR